jgi:hypothetical protein
MRTQIHFILSCLLFVVVLAPSASANGQHHSHRRGHDQRQSSSSFLGVPASDSHCSSENHSCDYVFSRSVSAEFHQRLSWILTEHLDAVENLGDRLCGHAEQKNECSGSFVAGLYNGLDALEMAVAEGSCGTLHLSWTKSEGLSQAWSTTNGDSCTD